MLKFANDLRRMTRRGVVALLAGFLLLPAPGAMANGAAAIVEALKDGGHVIYFRHGATTWSGVDRIDWPRSRQRLLSEEGIAQSETIGEAFRTHEIPVGEVLASPFARCRDMAEIAFGRVDERMELLGLLSDRSGRPARVAYLREQLTTPPQPGRNRIIVSHRSNIAEVASVRLAEGDAVVLRPTNGDFEIVGTLRPDEWRL